MGRAGAVSVGAVFAAGVPEHADEVALCGDGSTLTYGQLEARSNQVARLLAGAGVGHRDRVGLAVGRSVPTVVVMLALAKLGAATVPLDPAHPTERLRFMVERSRADLVVVDGDPATPLVPAGRLLSLDAVWEESLGVDADPIAVNVEAEDVISIMFTSGSTGRPKGVLTPHRAVTNLVDNHYLPFAEQLVMLHHSALSFDASTLEIWGPLLNGGRCVVHQAETPTAAALADAIARNQVDSLWLTAAMFNHVVDRNPEALAPLEHLLAGGEALSVKHVHRALQELPGVQLYNGYGPTETTTFACTHAISPAFDSGRGNVPIGRAIGGVELLIVDADLRPVPDGESGELLIGGAGVALGYVDEPQLTEERFLPHPVRPVGGGLVYRSGDRVRRAADGVIEFLGRLDDQVKLRGHRIEPGEVAAVCETHPGVDRAIVVVRGFGANDRRLVAYFTTRHDDLDTGELRRVAETHLPGFAVPSHFRRLHEVPRTPNGKVDVDALPDPTTADVIPQRVAPLTAQQHPLWFLDRMGQRVGYNVPAVFDLEGPLDRNALEVAIGRVIARHEALRTRVRRGATGPEQAVHAATPFHLDTSHLDEAAVEAFVTSAIARPFDIERDRPVRCDLIELNQDHHVLVLVLHHVVADGWSVGLLLDEIGEGYGRALGGEPLIEPPSTAQLADFAPASAHQWSSRQQEQLDRWREVFAGFDDPIHLASDHLPPEPRRRPLATVHAPVPSEVVSRLDAAAASCGATRFMTLLAAHQVFLQRCTGSNDLVTGTVTAGRNRAATLDVIGSFATTVAIRTAVSERDSFETVVGRVRAALFDAMALDDVAFDTVVDAVLPGRSGHDSPLFQTMFLNDAGSEPNLDLVGLRTRHVPTTPAEAKFDLVLRTTSENGFGIAVDYAGDLWERATIESLLSDYLETLAVVTDQPRAPVGAVTLAARPTRHPGVLPASPKPRSAGRSEVAERLASIWSTVLGVDDVREHQGFFELGGHSLLVLEAVELIRVEFGVDIPVAAFFGGATLGDLAERVAGGREPTRWAGSATTHDAGTGVELVRMVDGGDRCPLYFLPDVNGEVGVLGGLARRLDPSRPVYAVHLHQLLTEEADFQQLAARYADALEQHRQAGAFMLGGHSYSGFLAYEVAQHLRRRGREVVFVGIGDTSVAPVEPRTVAERAVLVGLIAANLPYWVCSAMSREPHSVEATQSLRSGFRRLRSVGRAACDGDAENRLEKAYPHLSPERGAHLRFAYRSLNAHTFEAYEGDVTVFRARTQPLVSTLGADLGWGRLVGGRLSVRVVPGTHMAMVAEPRVRAYARSYDAALRVADARIR